MRFVLLAVVCLAFAGGAAALVCASPASPSRFYNPAGDMPAEPPPGSPFEGDPCVKGSPTTTCWLYCGCGIIPGECKCWCYYNIYSKKTECYWLSIAVRGGFYSMAKNVSGCPFSGSLTGPERWRTTFGLKASVLQAGADRWLRDRMGAFAYSLR